jgi:hypothetical protein
LSFPESIRSRSVTALDANHRVWDLTTGKPVMPNTRLLTAGAGGLFFAGADLRAGSNSRE